MVDGVRDEAHRPVALSRVAKAHDIRDVREAADAGVFEDQRVVVEDEAVANRVSVDREGEQGEQDKGGRHAGRVGPTVWTRALHERPVSPSFDPLLFASVFLWS